MSFDSSSLPLVGSLSGFAVRITSSWIHYVEYMGQIQEMPTSTDGSGSATVWYFSYGSNLDPARFRARVCDFFNRKQAILHDYALRFSGEVTWVNVPLGDE